MKDLKSPLIYQGSKNRYANSIIKNLPKDYDSVLDMFCGSGEVGVGMFEGKKVTCNDFSHQLIDLHTMFQLECTDPEKFITKVKGFESKMGLGKPPSKGQEDHKEIISSLKSNYLKLRDLYNKTKDPLHLYTLHCNSFSNGMRFDSVGNFTQPYGQRYFNPSLQKKWLDWAKRLQKEDITFTSEDFRKVDLDGYDFVYADPFYLLTDSSYGETKKTGWGLKEEYSLYSKLDKYKGKFMLSNQLYSKGKENYILKEWIDSRDDLRIECLNSDSYKNCNYQREQGMTVELLIINY